MHLNRKRVWLNWVFILFACSLTSAFLPAVPKYEYTSLERVNVSGLRPFRKRPPTFLQYKLKIDDQIVTLTLKPNTQVLAPGKLAVLGGNIKKFHSCGWKNDPADRPYFARKKTRSIFKFAYKQIVLEGYHCSIFVWFCGAMPRRVG